MCYNVLTVVTIIHETNYFYNALYIKALSKVFTKSATPCKQKWGWEEPQVISEATYTVSKINILPTANR